jgi:glutamate--cysteine ligase
MQKNLSFDLEIESSIAEYYSKLYKDKEQIGIELEFVITKTDGSIVDLSVIKNLSLFIVRDLGFSQINDYDSEKTAVVMENPLTKDKINFETCYSTLEFSFSPAIRIQEIEDKFKIYYNSIQNFLLSKDHMLIDLGINPYSWIEKIPTLKNDYYSTVLPTISKYQKKTGSYIFKCWLSAMASSQTHFSLSEEKIVKVINILNKTEWVKGALFANSFIWNNKFDINLSLVARDYFWENSGLLSNNYISPVCDISFKDNLDYYKFLLHNVQTLFVIRNNKCIAIEKISVFEYLKKSSISGIYFDKSGKKVLIKIYPKLEDISYFRSYFYNTLTKRGTIETRSVCMQPFKDLFAPSAFTLGIINNLKKISNLISDLQEKNSILRKKSTQFGFFETDNKFNSLTLKAFLYQFLEIVKEGLIKRGFKEEKYINYLFERIDAKENPAIILIKEFQKGFKIEEILINRVKRFKL